MTAKHCYTVATLALALALAQHDLTCHDFRHIK